MSEEREMTPMEEAVRHTAEKIEAEEIAEIEAERHAAEHPEDHINGDYASELEECCGGHCGCHDKDHPTPEAPPTPGITYDEKGRRVTTYIHPVTSKLNIGRNDPCPCGSGKKFKKCCLDSLNEK